MKAQRIIRSPGFEFRGDALNRCSGEVAELTGCCDCAATAVKGLATHVHG